MPDLTVTRRRYEQARATFYIIAGAAVILFSGTMLWLGIEGHQTQDRIVDCTTPGRDCYESQFRELVSQLDALEERQRQFIEDGSIPAQEAVRINEYNQVLLTRILEHLGITPPPPPAPLPRSGPRPSTVPNIGTEMNGAEPVPGS